MTSTLIYTWAMPVVIAVLTGLWRGRRGVDGRAELLRALAILVLMVFAFVYAAQMIWIAAIIMTIASADSIAMWSFYMTFLTALVWLPISVITFISAAMRRRRADAA